MINVEKILVMKFVIEPFRLEVDSPVHTDGTQVEDGGGTQHHIHSHQSITDGGAQCPDTSEKLNTNNEKSSHVGINSDWSS